jgi:hypothetical protein
VRPDRRYEQAVVDPVRPGSLAFPGSNGAILAHCGSFHSYVSNTEPYELAISRFGILNVDPG